jgi:L-aminopeptidase/D-esterase-like protein
MTERARDLGIPFSGRPGPLNAITDVTGVEVGYTTLIEGTDVRTGVTALLPRGRAGIGDPCAAGWYSLNGNGEMTGTAWIEESGTLDLPVTITNTHAVGVAHAGTVSWVAANRPDLAEGWLLPVAAETWDGYLNDINGGHVTEAHVRAAIDSAATGTPAEGSVGGGTGMNCYGFKAGSGTASRVAQTESGTFTVGAFLQCNFGDRPELTLGGIPFGRNELTGDDPLGDLDRIAAGSGSVIGVVATDAPLLPGQCKALARRVPLGLARTGTSGSHFSGDLFLAFSTANSGAFRTGWPAAGATELGQVSFLQWGQVDPVSTALVEAVEEAVANALVAGREMIGLNGNRSPGLPLDVVRRRFGD